MGPLKKMIITGYVNLKVMEDKKDVNYQIKMDKHPHYTSLVCHTGTRCDRLAFLQ